MGTLKIESESLQHLTNLVEQLVNQKEERKIGRAEFAHMLNIEPETLDRKIREGFINRPYKDGRKSYWFLSYVQTIVKDTTNSANIATN
ncbi:MULTISPECIES: hypothetical protein [unclassified Acinetobacter]|uniref:hypothetical protein n=1 Tax=unclassified Acinetobacter TaxID=196816 RepID=UPI0018A90EF7|nr:MULTISPECIES: hypothetical protein [unclassified Acinetobacter]MBJ9953626.1 hypothetical protein [Acinetobacter baumannii]